jgi:WhiB family transcriptional regulator, redox-sensing transcriptional regulator
MESRRKKAGTMSLTLAPRPAWYDRAACRAFGPQIFYTEGHGAGWMSVQMVRRAKRICADCPVRADCLAASIDEPYGIWGGTTSLERRHIRQGHVA